MIKIIILLIKDFKLMILDMIKLILIPKISNNNTIKANNLKRINYKQFLTKNKQ